MTTLIQQSFGIFVLLQEGQLGPEQFQSGRGLIWTFVQTIFALGVVCLLAYLILRVVLPRLSITGAGRSMVRVVDRTPVDQRRSLLVIEVTGRWLLVGVSEAGLQLISELDPQLAEQEAENLAATSSGTRARATIAQTAANARTTFSDVFSKMVNKR
jgi:flagellar biosynthetic protein FliO